MGMASSSDMIIPLLRERRQEMTSRFDKVETRLDKMDVRLDKMDQTLVTFRHALSADSLLSKIVIGEYEERFDAIEKRLSDLETHK
jgi:tetrahydromethanopterin S-methyltransferase subunit G